MPSEIEIGGSGKRMPLHCRPFWWPWWGVEVIHGASPDAACPGQGYTGSHWTPPLGDYSLRIASAAARATANKTTMYYVPTLMAILMVIAMRRYYTTRIAQLRRSMAFIKATLNTAIGRTLASIASIRHVNAGCLFSFIVKKGSSWHVGPK